MTETTRGSLHIEGEEPFCNSARVQPHTSCLVKDVRRPCAQPPGCSARRAIEDFAAGRTRHDYADSPRAHCAYSSIVCLSEGRLSHGLVFSPVHVEASCIVCRREVRVNRKQRGAMQSPHEGGDSFACILLQLFRSGPMLSGPAESQISSETNIILSTLGAPALRLARRDLSTRLPLVA